jgi:hypothetical protein
VKTGDDDLGPAFLERQSPLQNLDLGVRTLTVNAQPVDSLSRKRGPHFITRSGDEVQDDEEGK